MLLPPALLPEALDSFVPVLLTEGSWSKSPSSSSVSIAEARLTSTLNSCLSWDTRSDDRLARELLPLAALRYQYTALTWSGSQPVPCS